MPAPLIKSHPEIVKEIRRLAKNGKSRAQIIAAIKEKFNYNTTFTAVNDWAGVDFKPVGSGTPLSPEKIEEIKNLMSGDNPPTHKEAAKILGVGERSIHQYKDTAPYRTPKQWAEQYPDLERRLLSSDRAVAVTALNTAGARERRDIAREIAKAANKSRLEAPDFTPLTDAEAEEYARKKADHVVKGQKQRALLYRISPKPGGPQSFLSYPEYRKLQKSGNAPKILGRHYQGDFTKEGTAALRQIYYDAIYPYLKAGGNPNTIDMHLGHIIAMKGVDPVTGIRNVSGLTNRFNVQMQAAELNRKQSNKVFQELLKKLGYHTGQGGFGKVGLLTTLAGGGTALGLGGLLATEEGRGKAMETLALLGVPQEKMFETMYKLQGQGEWKGDRRIDAGDIVQNAMGQDWMSKHPNLYAGISTASDLILDPINVVGGGLLKAGASGLRKLRNIWGN